MAKNHRHHLPQHPRPSEPLLHSTVSWQCGIGRFFRSGTAGAREIRSRGFEVRCVGEKEYSPEEDLKSRQALATLSGYKAFRHMRSLDNPEGGPSIRARSKRCSATIVSSLCVVDQVSMGWL